MWARPARCGPGRNGLEELPTLARLRCHAGCLSHTLVAAGYRRLRAKGITIRRTADLITGSWRIDEKVPLLHADRDFDRLTEHEGLAVVD